MVNSMSHAILSKEVADSLSRASEAAYSHGTFILKVSTLGVVGVYLSLMYMELLLRKF